MYLPTNPFRRTDRFDEISFGILFLAVALFFGFFGFRGAFLYARGSREAPADPLAWGIGILACAALTYLAFRLFLGRHRARSLLPNLVLLLCGVGGLAGAIWMIELNEQVHGSLLQDYPAALAGAAGVAALVQWWRRTHRARPGA